MKLFIILCLLIHNILADSKYHQTDHLDPLNYDYDGTENPTSENDKDKRTIFPQTIEINNWAKHYGISPTGKKVVLGYGPVGLKHVPVIKPITIQHKIRPHIHLRPFRPSIQLKPSYGGWKPIVPVRPVVVPAKPVVPVHVPPPHFVRPLPPHHHHHDFHDYHLHHDHVDVHHDIQHQIHHAIVHGPHHHHHVDVPVAKPVPVIPAAHPVVAHPVVPAVKPFIPSPALFEVAKPNLGVLPLGATFPSPVLQDLHLHHIKAAPHAHLVPQAHAHLIPEPVHSHLVPQPIHGHLVQQPVHNHLLPQQVHSHLVPQPIHSHLVPQPIHNHLVPTAHNHLIQEPVHTHLAQEPIHSHLIPQGHFDPAGHSHFVPNQLNPEPIHNIAPHNHFNNNPPGTIVEYHGTRHFVPVNGHAAPAPLPQDGYPHPGGQEQHDVQTPYLPANHPVFQQGTTNTGQFSQPDPQQVNYQPQFQQEIPNIQGHFQQLVQGNGQSIQPGLTDLQFPLHLPHHPTLGGQQYISKRNDKVAGEEQKNLTDKDLKEDLSRNEKAKAGSLNKSYDDAEEEESAFDSYESDDIERNSSENNRKD